MYSMGSSDWSEQTSGENQAPSMRKLQFCRISPSVAQKRRAVLETKHWKTKVVWFPVLVSMLILWMIPWSKPCRLLNKTWWKVKYWCDLPFHPLTSGLHTLTQELRKGVVYWEGDSKYVGLDIALQEMFPTSAEEKVDVLKSLAESYHKYKREYVKNLCFNPDNENLSK